MDLRVVENLQNMEMYQNSRKHGFYLRKIKKCDYSRVIELTWKHNLETWILPSETPRWYYQVESHVSKWITDSIKISFEKFIERTLSTIRGFRFGLWICFWFFSFDFRFNFFFFLGGASFLSAVSFIGVLKFRVSLLKSQNCKYLLWLSFWASCHYRWNRFIWRLLSSKCFNLSLIFNFTFTAIKINPQKFSIFSKNWIFSEFFYRNTDIDFRFLGTGY